MSFHGCAMLSKGGALSCINKLMTTLSVIFKFTQIVIEKTHKPKQKINYLFKINEQHIN